MKLNRRPVNRVGDLNVPTALWTESPPSPPSCSLTISFICCLSLLTFNLHVVFHVYLKRCFKMKKMMNHLFYFSCFCFCFFCLFLCQCHKMPRFWSVNFSFINDLSLCCCLVFFFWWSISLLLKPYFPRRRSGFHSGWLTSLPCFIKARLLFFFLLLRTMM